MLFPSRCPLWRCKRLRKRLYGYGSELKRGSKVGVAGFEGVGVCAAVRAMVAAGDTVEMHEFAMPIGNKIIEYVSVAENGKGDFRADQLRAALAALPISSDVTCDKMSASMIDFFMWVAETSLKNAMSIVYKDVDVMYSIVLNALSVKQGYAGLNALSAWGDVPASMHTDVVAPLIRTYRLSSTRNVWVFEKIGVDIPSHQAMKMAFIRMFQHAAADAKLVVSASFSMYEGAHHRIETLVDEYVTRERGGRAIPPRHRPSMSLLEALLKMRNSNSLGHVPLKDCCSEKSFEMAAAMRTLDGIDEKLAAGLKFLQSMQSADPNGNYSGLQLDATRLGLGKVSEANFFDNMIVRQYGKAIMGILTFDEMQMWIDAFDEKWRAPDADKPLLILAEATMSMQWPRKVNASTKLAAVIKDMVRRENHMWHDYYYGPMAAAREQRSAARLAALENARTLPLAPAPAPPVLSDTGGLNFHAPQTRAKTWGCLHSFMSESKAVKHRDKMNLDLLPFDGGIGCGPFHNHGTCTCNSAKSHQCPLKSCGQFHPFKKFHVNLDWKGNEKKLVAPYAAAAGGGAPAAAPATAAAAAAAPAGGAAPPAKGKGKGKKGKKGK